MVVKFLRRLKQAYLQFLAFKNLKIMKKCVCAYTTANLPDSSIPATLFTGKVN